jgi:hypothetical protein
VNIAPSPIRSVRSTLLISSRAALGEAQLLPSYEAHLDPASRDWLRNVIAGTWIPIERMMEHYRACDALALSPTTQRTLGRRNGDRLRGTLLGTLAKLAQNAGTTPVTMIEQMPRFWGRIFDGGAIFHEPRGPKDVVVRVCAEPLLSSSYFRNGLAGLAESLLGLVATRLFVRVSRFQESEATYLVQWV